LGSLAAWLRSIAGFVELSAGPWRVAQFPVERFPILEPLKTSGFRKRARAY
jgi:hypothetical protein